MIYFASALVLFAIGIVAMMEFVSIGMGPIRAFRLFIQPNALGEADRCEAGCGKQIEREADDGRTIRWYCAVHAECADQNRRAALRRRRMAAAGEEYARLLKEVK